MAEHLPFRYQSLHHPNADWMARITHLEAFIEAMLPVWTQRLLNTPLQWVGHLNLTIGDAHFLLQISQKGIQIIRDLTYYEDGANRILLTHKAFAQLCFAFRPVRWFAAQPEQHIPPALLPVLEVLFPPAPAWVAGSDYF